MDVALTTRFCPGKSSGADGTVQRHSVMKLWAPAAALLAVGGLSLGASQGGMRVLSDRSLPNSLGRVGDLRWATSDALYLAAGKNGGLRLQFEPNWGKQEVLVPTGRSLWVAARIGASAQYVAVAAPAHTVSWLKLSTGELRAVPLYSVVDLDVFEGRLVVLGTQKDESERYAPDGAMAWVGSLDKDLSDLKPVHYSLSGPGSRGMAACGAFETGAVRFLKDGSFVVVPGVEPGIFLYDRNGKLLRTWETQKIGLDAECGLTDEQMYLLSASLEPRAVWINQRRTLDDVVALPQGAGLLVRQAQKGATVWDFHVLQRDGTVTSSRLPFRLPSPHWHLRADVRGDRIAFLLMEYSLSSQPSTPRLILTTLPL